MKYLLLCLLLAGCTSAMTNDQIIAEVKKCESAGMMAVPYQNGWQAGVVKVVCLPKEETK